MMKPPAAFIEALKAFNMDSITDKMLKSLKTKSLLLNPEFTYENMCRKSSAAANLANWVINIVKYKDILDAVAQMMEDNQNEAEEPVAV